MLTYVAKRIVTALVLIYLVATIIFLLLFLVPGDPAALLLSSGGVAPPPEAVAQLRDEMGLNKPVLTQYGDYLRRLTHGNLGQSFQDNSPVAAEIGQRLPRTLELIGTSAVLSLLVGVPLGVWSARRRTELPDRVMRVLSGLALSIPTFVLGTLFVLVFAQWLKWLPAGGFASFADNPWRHLQALLMPTVAIAVGFGAMILRMTRATVLSVMGQDWVRTARAKGLNEAAVWRRHIVRNALGPVLTLTGLQIGSMIGGIVLVEYVFNWPGLSGMLVNAVNYRDYPEVQGIVLVVATLFILLNVAVDLLYSLLDPRVRRT